MTYPIIRMRGLMRRRLLLNFRVPPALLATRLPPPFRPRLVNGWGLVGLCAIRLEQLRPAGLPAQLGIRTENAAQRIAVEWTDPQTGQTRRGVYLPRRETSSRLTRLAGGRLFPGRHGGARIDVQQSSGAVHLRARDRAGVLFDIDARAAEALPPTSCFGSLDAASEFFASGDHGYSAGADPFVLEGVRLEIDRWAMQPLAVDHVYVRELAEAFPADSLHFDSAFLMRDVPHVWQRVPPLQLTRPEPAPTMIYDAACNLCHWVVRFVVPRDPAGVFRFAAAQSTTTATRLAPLALTEADRDGPLLLEDGQVWTHSTAALRITRRLRWPWSLVGTLGLLVPRFLRDAAYRLIERNRRVWFGACAVHEAPLAAGRTSVVRQEST